MFVVPRPRMLVERVQFALWEQSAVGGRMIAEAEPDECSISTIATRTQPCYYLLCLRNPERPL